MTNHQLVFHLQTHIKQVLHDIYMSTEQSGFCNRKNLSSPLKTFYCQILLPLMSLHKPMKGFCVVLNKGIADKFLNCVF